MIKIFLPLLFIILIGCSKSGDSVLSSSKEISSVIFKASDNPMISSDINGTITGDSIKFNFPSGISLSNLIPTIVYSGKSISPSNKTSQNFNSVIRYTVTAENGSSINYYFKISQPPIDTPTAILGTWKILKDSVVNNNWINPAGGNLTPGVYIGAPNDFWKFEANGVFSGRENNITGADTYYFQNNKLVIPIWSNQYGPATLQTLNNSSLIVFFSATSANGGYYSRTVFLNR